MPDTENEKPGEIAFAARKIATLFLGVLIGGGLMAWREELTSPWARSVASAIAFVALFLAAHSIRSWIRRSHD